MKKSKKAKNKKSSTQLTTQTAAEHCQVSIPTLKRWIHAGSLAAFRTPGGHYRIDLGEFQRFLRSQGMPAYPAARAELRVLIADDDPEIVDMLTAFLADDPRGFKVEAATDGYEALIKVGAFKPSVLILDIVMPGLDGIEVCRRLRAAPETRAIKILGLTGHPEAIPALMDAGAHACLAKPLGLKELRAELERLLARPEASC